MLLVDLIAYYVFFLKILLTVTAVFIVLSSLDDLFIGLVYWVRTIRRALFVRKKT